MTKMQPIPNDAVLVAIDVANARNEVLIEAPGHRRRRRLTVLNSRVEHDRLIATLTTPRWAQNQSSLGAKALLAVKPRCQSQKTRLLAVSNWR